MAQQRVDVAMVNGGPIFDLLSGHDQRVSCVEFFLRHGRHDTAAQRPKLCLPSTFSLSHVCLTLPAETKRSKPLTHPPRFLVSTAPLATT